MRQIGDRRAFGTGRDERAWSNDAFGFADVSFRGIAGFRPIDAVSAYKQLVQRVFRIDAKRGPGAASETLEVMIDSNSYHLDTVTICWYP
jgi:hypothetical protein